MNKLTAVLNTDGCGYWSDVSKDVKVIGYAVPYINDDQDFGELRVYFDVKSWDVNKDGLIYTDRQFEKELVELFTRLGLAGSDISYSEQGMQGDNYVSLDIGEDFIKSLKGRNEIANVLA
jgi:hypothetical protein